MSITHQSFCPRCQTYLVFTTDKKIFCPSCRLAFNKNILEKVIDEDLLSDQELNYILESLKCEGDIYKLKV